MKNNPLLVTLLITALTALLSSSAHSQVFGEEIISWDFNDGIPADWVNESASGIAQWEYRGPATTPDNLIASRGSCGQASVPIESTTTSNGFVIFDSNYWDDDEGPCGNLGSGIDPAPHAADLITAPIDLTGQNSVVLTFQQQYKNFQCATGVSLSINGGLDYVEIITNSPQQGYYSGDIEFVSIDISALAGNEPDVRIKFSFEGIYYHWMLDDISLYIPNVNDLLVTDARYTAFDFNQGDTGLGKMEYSIYPNDMVQPLQFYADVFNVGSAVQTQVELNAKVYDSSENLEAELTSGTQTISATQSSTIGTAELLPPTEIDDYRIEYTISQAELDENLANNTAESFYSVSDYTWARDQKTMEAAYLPAEQFINSHFEHGNYFESTSIAELKCTSLAVAFSDSSEVGSIAYAKIYNFDRTEVLAESEPYEINSYDLNTEGESKFVTLQLIEPLILYDSLYLAIAGSNQQEGIVRLGASGNSPAQTSILTYPIDNAIFYSFSTPMVRMNIFPANTTPGCTDAEAVNYDPAADTDDGSCLIAGCTNSDFANYNPEANFDDGSCSVVGCPDPEADNYDPDADIFDEDLCIYLGCTDEMATNYDADANEDDGSCLYEEASLAFSAVSGCSPFMLEITNQTLSVPEATCIIDLGDDTIISDCSQTIINHEYTEPGEYTVNYTYQVGDFISTFSQIITVDPPLAVPIIEYDGLTNTVLCSNCTGANMHDWYLDGELILEDAPFVIINPEDGTYTLESTSVNNCVETSAPLMVVSLEELSEVEFLVYPNPANELITIETKAEKVRITIVDLTGKTVVQAQLIGSAKHNLSTAHLSAGIYAIKCTSPSGEISKQLIIE